jgi:hypothetical protein
MSVGFVATIALTVLLFVTAGWNVMTDTEPAPICVPSGVYTGVYNQTDTFTRTVIPTDPLGNTMTGIYKARNVDPTIGRSFDADHMSDYVGNMVRTGPNTWASTGISYGTKKVQGSPRPEIVYIAIVEATMTYTDDAKTEVLTGTFAFYSPGDDADGDGFPDEGAMPIWSGPLPTTTATRMPMVSPYQ